MKISAMADDANLRFLESKNHLDNLEKAILCGQSKRPISDLTRRRSRLPALKAAARALDILNRHRDMLPNAILAEIEEEDE